MIARAAVAALLVVCHAVGPSRAEDAANRGPRLGAATSFAQSWYPDVLSAASELPLRHLRDEIWWKNVETDGGDFVYDNPRTSYPDRLDAINARLLFLVNNPHRNYDGGTTPSTPEGAAAFARYAATTLRRFQAIEAIEVGNEMNSETFAWGPGWDGDLATRAASYVQLLAATAKAAREVRPGIEILGGAAHSIPIAWFQEIFARGAAAHMDTLVIHPYTVRPEQLARQIRLLREWVPETAAMPLAVTEYGQTDAETAPAYLLKSYCQQALSGVTWSIWYPFNPRGDGLAALITPDGTLTETGRTFRLIQERFEGKPVEDISPDPFTYGCRFGSDQIVIWGEPRKVMTSADVHAIDPVTGGRRSASDPYLSPDQPLILVSSDGELRIGTDVRLEPSSIVADSWHQFGYPGAEGALDPFLRLARQGTREYPLQTRPGQERGGVPWTPYLGTDIDGVARATAEWVLPSGSAAAPIEIVLRHVVAEADALDIELRVDPWRDNGGAIVLSVSRNGARLHHASLTSTARRTIPGVAVAAGDQLDFGIVGTDGRADGAGFRVILRRAAR